MAFILWFKELSNADVDKVGGKNASLGEMYRELKKKKVRVPNGFAITAEAYKHYLQEAGIEEPLKKQLKGLKRHTIRDLEKRGRAIRDLFLSKELPQDLQDAILKAYHTLSKTYGDKNTDVAVRSSATAEDLPTASFAGQQETFLNISGETALLDACKRCFASLFTNRAIVYREENKFDHLKVYLSIGVQKMVRSKSSGVMFTIDTETGFRNAILINSAYGLGENVVQGKVNPDQFYVFKPTLDTHQPILSKTLGEKSIRMIYSGESTKIPVKNVDVSTEDQERFSITDKEILTLARWGNIIEDHYSKKKGKFTPMDIEWAKDDNDTLFIVQARPETVQSQRDPNVLETYKLEEKGTTLAQGQSIGNKIGVGKAHVIMDVKHINKFKKGEVLITEMTDPDWVPIMRQAGAIVTNRGGRTCHAAIVSRELGIPCIVGTKNATETVKTGQDVTVVCSQGDVGRVYKGKLKFHVKKTNLKKLPKLKTKIMMNLGDPTQAFDYSFLPVKGVGLAREEFIISSSIQIHPRALQEYPKVPADVKEKIDELTKGYEDKQQYFIDKLAEGIAMIAAAFHPEDVIVRLSDFKTNEYADLIGGKKYEPEEHNPMIGWRGASRYYHKDYRDAFGLECKALLKVREEMGLENVKIMIPFCRTPEEGKKVLKEMRKHGLHRGKKGLEIYVMCEVPSNVLLADEFSKIFDGFSIGSNDLTQLTLAVDRDSELVANLYDERNDAVKQLISKVIKKAKKNKRKIGICGDAPSTYPEFAQFLVKEGIDSMSLSPDAVLATFKHLRK
ncbi:phosphoenolpyruvate synthase [Candidatus Woesearchaeota archaeon]|nr:phosphoenolpyruvate synthase [Candidatus Woesearchaeota archaeon]